MANTRSRKESKDTKHGDHPAQERHFIVRYIGVIVALHAIIGTLAVIAHIIDRNSPLEEQRQAAQAREVARIGERTEPVGKVVTDPAALAVVTPAAAAPAASGAPKAGDTVVAQACAACHQSGAMGAPKIGDAAAWKTRTQVAGGMDGLVQSAIAGKGAMPPKGGQPGLSDEEIRAAVEYMTRS